MAVKTGNGFAADDFTVDWQQQIATCPEAGKHILTLAIDGRDNAVIIKFRAQTVQLVQAYICVLGAKQRTITLRPEQQYKALQSARQQAMTSDYQADYARRAGIEGTLSEGVRAHGLHRARYIGLAKPIYNI